MENIVKIAVITIIILMASLISYIVWDENQDTPSIAIEPVRINLERVLYNECHHYSILWKDENDLGHDLNITLGEKGRYADVIIKYDVPEGQPIWALVNRGKTPRGKIYYTGGGEIHVRSGQNIGGGGWNHGKFGHGQTTVVE